VLFEQGAQFPPQSIPISPGSKKPFSHGIGGVSFFLHEENMINIAKKTSVVLRISFNLS
jgi:hypothetical protein